MFDFLRDLIQPKQKNGISIGGDVSIRCDGSSSVSFMAGGKEVLGKKPKPANCKNCGSSYVSTGTCEHCGTKV